jgi:hypothetical protein
LDAVTAVVAQQAVVAEPGGCVSDQGDAEHDGMSL